LGGALAIAGVLGLLGAPRSAAAEDLPEPKASGSNTLSKRDAVIRELQEALADRDVAYRELELRLAALERAFVQLARAASGSGSPTVRAADPADAPKGEGGSPEREAPASTVETHAAAEADGSAGQDPGDADSPKSGPGQFEVEEDTAERALERTLTAAGALLLLPGSAELSTSISYTHGVEDTVTILPPPPENLSASLKARRDVVRTELQLQIGLPYDSQIELGLPYSFVDQEVFAELDFLAIDRESEWGHGIGDLRVGLAKGLLREGRWWPDAIARVFWDTDTGRTRDGPVVLGRNGFNELGGSLTLTKRQDPLVFVGNVGYETSFEKYNIEHGDRLNVLVGAFLAASPETSLRFVFQQGFTDEVRINEPPFNGKLPASDLTTSVLTLGASSVIGRGVLLDLSVGAGLTDDAPDYTARLSMAWRFNLFSEIW
jgi:hypothetical protein